MKKSIFYKILKWIVASATGLITLPLTFLVVISSFYPNMFKENTVQEMNFNPYQLKSYYELFDRQKGGKIAKSPIDIVPNEKKYRHILIIDRTLSTNDKELDKKLVSFSTDLRNRLFSKSNQNDFVGFNEQNIIKSNPDLTIKHLLILRFYQELISDKLASSIMVGFFDGDKVEYFDWENKFGKNEFYNELTFYPLTDLEKRKEYVKWLSKEKLLFSPSNGKSQESDFFMMFDEINTFAAKSNDNDKIILTVVSDFDHDVTPIARIPNRTIEDFKKKNNGRIDQYNLIYCPPSTRENRERSDELVKDIINQIKGLDNLMTIDLRFYVNYDKDMVKIFENQLLQCLCPISRINQKITFYYPKENTQGIRTAKSIVQVKKDGKNEPFEWKISTIFPQKEDDDYFVSYAINEDELDRKSRCTINDNWYLLAKEDSLLYLEMGLNNHMDVGRYRFEIKQGKNNFERYNIELQECLPLNTASLGTMVLNVLCILILLIVTSGTILVSSRNYGRLETNKGWKIVDNSIVSLILALVWWYICLDFEYLWLRIISIVIPICFIVIWISSFWKIGNNSNCVGVE